MPIYPYRCDKCHRRWDAIHAVATRGDEKCRKCGKPAIREIAVGAKPQIIDEYMEGLGTHITGPAHMRRVMKEKNLEEVGKRDVEQATRKWM